MSDLIPRIKRIQKALGVTADGIIGPGTLTAAERKLGLSMVTETRAASAPPKRKPGALHSMAPSIVGVDKLIGFEVSSRSYYTRKLAAPSWPGGASGVTIGIGYDVGYNTPEQIEADWGSLLPDAYVQDLKGVAGLKKTPARDAAKRLADGGLVVPWDAAKQVFELSTLPRFAKITKKAYPGVDNLPNDAQAAILSLVYNRGASKTGSSRLEMKELGPCN